MTYGALTDQDFGDFQWIGPTRRPVLPRLLLCAAAVSLSASIGAWALHAMPGARSGDLAASDPLATATIPAAAKPQSAAMPAPARFAALRGPSYLSPTFTSGTAPVAFAQGAPLRSWFEPRKSMQTAALESAETDAQAAEPQVAASEASQSPESTQTSASAEPTIVPALPPEPALLREVPLPARRPAFLASGDAAPSAAGRRRMAPQVANLAAADAPASPAAEPSFFDRLFRPQQGPALAYAAPDDGGLLAAARSAPDRYTAVYNIASHTVTLPDGTQLEAHSGIGPNKDNPRSVAMHMRGATPPAVYDLTSREALFHGVAALRLNPVGDMPPYGRMGLLAHTYMLGPHGDSNGCVVFRDFASFRHAYDNGQIRRLVVVAGI